MTKFLLFVCAAGLCSPMAWADPAGFHCLDLSKAANRGVTQSFDEASQKVEDLQEKIGFKNIPVGPQIFRGIPFQIIDPLQNGGRHSGSGGCPELSASGTGAVSR